MKKNSIFAPNTRTMFDFYTPTAKKTEKATKNLATLSELNCFNKLSNPASGIVSLGSETRIEPQTSCDSNTPPTSDSRSYFEPETPPTPRDFDDLASETPPTPFSVSSLKATDVTGETTTDTFDLSSTKRCNSSIMNRKQKRRYEQLYLDLGQTSFGARTICPTCNTLYVQGMKEDADNHRKICDEYIHGVVFHDFKHSRNYPVQLSVPKDHASRKFITAKVIEIRSTDPYPLLQKVASVKYIVDHEMGFVSSNHTDNILHNKVVFLYVVDKRVIGFCSVEVIAKAYQVVVPTEEDTRVTSVTEPNTTRRYSRSLLTSKARMGVHQIWCHNAYRRLGISKCLLDMAREKLIYGMVIPRNMVAFSSPTEDGFGLACNYLETELPLVYDCT